MELLGNDSLSFGVQGGLNQHPPCQAIRNVSWVSVDTSKRDTLAYPDINEVQFSVPVKRGVASLSLREFHYPYFASQVTDQYFNVIIDELGVLDEGSSSSNATGNNVIIRSITLQAPMIETAVGSGWCLWRWEDGGQKPILYYPRQQVTGFRIRLVDKQNVPITTGIVAGSTGPTMRFVFAISHK